MRVQVPALIPLLDLANHDDALAPNVSVFFDTEIECARVSAPKDFAGAYLRAPD